MGDNPIPPYPGSNIGTRRPKLTHRNLKKISLEQARQDIRDRREAQLEATRKEKRFQKSMKTRRMIRRGYNMNTLRNGIRMYGFLGRMEGPPTDNWTIDNTEDAWYLQFECIDARWMDQMIDIMRNDGRLEAVAQFLQDRPFDTAWGTATAAERHQLSRVYLSFIDTLARTNPFQGIFECLVDVRYLSQRHVDRPVLADWFELVMVERPDDRQETNGIFFESMQGAFDEEAEFYDLGLLRRLQEPWQGFMKAINYPNLEPEPPLAFGFGPGNLPGMFRSAVDMLRALGRRVRREWDRLTDGDQWAPAGQLAGLAGVTMPVPAPPGRPMAYCGHAGANTMAAGGGNIPFVGVVNVGQGNLNMLVDTHWHILAYYDFGWTLNPHNGPNPHPALCFCDRPTIIISNFDRDHWGLAEKYAESYGMRWIAPQFHQSTVSNKIAGKVILAGGQYCLFNTSPGRRYIPFPWGYVERCTGAGSNGSGTAALVCVRDPPGAVPVAGVPVPGGLGVTPRGAEHDRAHAAVALVPGGTPNEHAIKAVAAALAASAWGNSMHNLNGPAATVQIHAISTAAVTAALLPGATVGSVSAALPNPPHPPAAQYYGFRSLAGAGAARAAVAQAAIGAVVAANLRATCQAAADAIWAGNGVGADIADQTTWQTLVRNSVQGWGALPQVMNNGGPVAATERFILLTGDAFFMHVPGIDAVPPHIVAMTAAHHGSRQADAEMLEAIGTPWAPGSRQAWAAHEASQGADAIDCAVRAAMALNPAAIQANVLLDTTRTTAAAVAALRDSLVMHPIPANLLGIRQCAFGAAASALSLQQNADGRHAGVAAIVSAVANHQLAVAATFTSAVHQFFAQGAGLNQAHVDNTGLFDILFATPIVNALTGPLAVPGASAANDAQAAPGHLAGQLPKSGGMGPRFGAIATRAVARYGNGNGVLQANMIATVAGPHAGAVNAANALPLGGWAPLNQAQMEKTTVLLAASGAAGIAANVSPEDVVAAMEAFALGHHVRASAVRNEPAGAQIAYSYGVRAGPDYHHEYRAKTLGNLGHGHPAAVQVYKARGWDQRFNTSARAHQNPAQGDGASPRGHVALCWDHANDAASPGFYSNPPVGAGHHTIPYICPTCNNALTFNK